MHPTTDSAFDFEGWVLLAKTDPQAFEARRESEIARLIADAAPRMRSRLRGLQWKIDAERNLATNPLSSCVRIFNQMWDSVYGERGLLEALHGLEGKPLPECQPADVYELHHRNADQRRSKISFPAPHS